MTTALRPRYRAALVAIVAMVVSMLATPLSGTASAAIYRQFYAAPSGSGTDCTLALPCSLLGVRNKVRPLTATMTGDIVVNVRGGTYLMAPPLTLESSDSGRNGHSVIWQAYGTEKPVLSGGQSLSGGWALVDAAKNIYRRTGVTSEFRDLWVGSSSATTTGTRARHPNLTNDDNFGSYQRVVSVDPTNKTYRIAASQITSWSNLQDVEMVNQPHWYHDRLRVASYTTDSTYANVSFQSTESAEAFIKGADFYANSPYYWENAYEFLDVPGEWYLNKATDSLYYIPRTGQNMASATVVSGFAPTLLKLIGTASAPIRDIQIRGLEFANTGWNGPSTSGLVATQGVRQTNNLTNPQAVHVEYATNIRISGNRFRQLASEGISFAVGVKNSRIVGNTFTSIGANAIVLDDRGVKNPSAVDQTESILVANNVFTGVGQTYHNGDAIMAYFIKNTVIEYNTISDAPYTAIQIGGQTGGTEAGMSNNVIRFNEIHHFVQAQNDGGAIYTLGRQTGTHIFQNWIHHYARSPWALSKPIAGVYLDNYSEYIRVECNAIDDIGTGATAIYEQSGGGAKNNTWILNCGNEQAVRDNAGVRADYVEP